MSCFKPRRVRCSSSWSWFTAFAMYVALVTSCADETAEETPCVDLVLTPDLSPREIRIEPGTFEFGHSDEYWTTLWDYEPGEVQDRVEVTLTISYPFYVDETETSHQYWLEVVGYSNTLRPECAECAEENLHFFDTLLYANLRSERAGLRPCYDLSGCVRTEEPPYFDCVESTLRWDRDCDGYRLPTRAEWVYFARAGTTSDYLCEPADYERKIPCMRNYAWTRHRYDYPGFESNETYSLPGGQLCPNNFGLYDVYGNVGEYIWEAVLLPEWWPEDGAVDPVGPEPGLRRGVAFGVMGGSSYTLYDFLGSSHLLGNYRSRSDLIFSRHEGVRLVRTIRE